MDEAFDGAMAAVSLGVRVFPVWSVQDGVCRCGKVDCDSPGKHPVEASWQRLASTNHRIIERWTRLYPGCNFGLLTDDVHIVDVDPRNGGSLGNLPEGLPKTCWVVRTGGGGWHLGYAPAGVAVHNAKNVTPGVDVKASGGFVVAPGSRHASGARYVWVARPGARDALPVWPLGAAIASASPDGPVRSHLADRLAAPASVGDRNVWLTSVAGHYAKYLPAEDMFWASLRMANVSMDQPVSDAELEKVGRSIWDREHARSPAAKADDQFRRDVEARKYHKRVDLQANAELVVPSLDGLVSLSGAEYVELGDDGMIWAIEDLLVAGGNALLAAQYKVGKTTLLLNLLRSMCDGSPFLNRFSAPLEEGRRVGFWDYEMTERQFRRWVKRIGIKHPDRFVILHLRGRSLRLGVDLADDYAVDWLRKWNVQTWIIDPYAKAYSGESENDNAMVDRFTTAVDHIKEQAGVDAAVLGAHFGRQDFEPGSEHVRGATRLDDWADARWIMTRDKDKDRYFAALGRDVEIDEGRLLFGHETLSYSWVQGGRAERRYGRVEEKVLQYLASIEHRRGTKYQRSATKKAIQESVSGGAVAVSRALDTLVDRGSLVRRTDPVTGAMWHYSLDHPEAGQGVLDE